MTEAARTAVLATATVSGCPGKASSVMRRETVNPMPASTPTAEMSAQRIAFGNEARVNRATRNAVQTIPIG